METFDQQQKVVEIGSLQKPVGKTATTLTLIGIIIFSVIIAFGIGFFIGQSQVNSPRAEKTGKVTKETVAGKVTLKDTKEGYQVTFAESYKLTEKSGAAPGFLLESDGNSIEMWLLIEQPYTLAKEQTEAIEKTTKIKWEKTSGEIEGTEHKYKTGGYFTVFELKATKNQPLTTFWIKAVDQNGYEAAKTVLETFKFL